MWFGAKLVGKRFDPSGVGRISGVGVPFRGFHPRLMIFRPFGAGSEKPDGQPWASPTATL